EARQADHVRDSGVPQRGRRTGRTPCPHVRARRALKSQLYARRAIGNRGRPALICRTAKPASTVSACLAKEQPSMSARTPEDLDRLFALALNSGNLEALVRLYEPQAALRPGPGQVVQGDAAIRTALSGFIGMKPTIELMPTQ